MAEWEAEPARKRRWDTVTGEGIERPAPPLTFHLLCAMEEREAVRSRTG